MSTTTRTLIAFLLLVVGAFYFLLGRLTDRVERQYMEAAEVPMVDTAHLLASVVEAEFATGDFELERFRTGIDAAQRRQFEAKIYSFVKRQVGMNVYVTDGKGVVIYDSRGGKAEGEDFSDQRDVRLTLAGGYGARSTRTDIDNPDTSVMFVAAPIHLDGKIGGVVSVIKPQVSLFEFVEETIAWIRYYGWMVMITILLSAILLSHWFSSPLRQLTEFARSVCRGERVAMPKFAGTDVRTLAVALDEMRDSLEDRQYVERYVQTLTHEMKSPVAAIRGASELLEEEGMPAEERRKFLGNISVETERLQKNIDRLLVLSEIESMKSLDQSEDIELDALIRTVVDSYGQAIKARNIHLKLDLCNRRVIGQPFLLESAIGNLLQNAIDFTPAEGVISVRVGEGDHTTIVVENDGPLVPEYALERAFERVYSLQHPSTGKKSSGLGLCFVREAAHLHGGEAKLENREEPPGVRAIIVIP